MDIEESYKKALEEIKGLDLPEEDRDAVLTAVILKKLLEEGVSPNKINTPKNEKINIDWEEVPYQEGSLGYNILKCVEEGFFNTPRNTSEILSELERKAVNCKSESSLTWPLRSLVKDDYLDRVKQENSEGKKVWHYVSPIFKG